MGVTPRTAKRPFNIHAVIRRILNGVQQFADAAMFDLADPKVLTSFRGVGPKCANLTLGIVCGANRNQSGGTTYR